MKKWIGKSIILIGTIHMIFGFIVYRSSWIEMLQQGLFNTVDGQTNHVAAFWFIAFGLLVLILGALTNWCENKEPRLPGFLGWSLLVLSVFGVIMMSASGWWLLIIPSIGAIRRSQKITKNVSGS